MSSRNDLLEAYAFGRRRLVTALVSGAPGGREAEPSRSGRAVVAGVAVAVLVVLGGWIWSLIARHGPVGWDARGVVVSKDTGERFLITSDGGELRPLLNIASAELVLGMHYRVTVVSQKALADRTPGPPVGILGAPPDLPSRPTLVASGWTACTAAGAGIAVDVSRSPPVAAWERQGLVVRSAGHDYLVAQGSDGQAHAFPIASPLSAQGLFLRGAVPPVVPVLPAWLALLGPPVSLRPPANVTAVRTSAGYDAVRASLGRWEAMAIGPFAAFLLAQGQPPRHELPRDALANEHLLPTTTYARWPAQLLVAAPAGPVCAQLGAGPHRRSSIASLVVPTGAPAWPTPTPTARGAPIVRVDPGSGAFVRSASGRGEGAGTTFLIASTGRKYRLADPTTLGVLGLASYPAPAVDAPWLDLFREGPELAQRAVVRTRSSAAH